MATDWLTRGCLLQMLLLAVPREVWEQVSSRHQQLCSLARLCVHTLDSAPSGLKNEATMLQAQLRALAADTDGVSLPIASPSC